MRLEIEYLADMFRKNEHDRKMLQKIINIFEKETNRINNNNNNNDKKQTNTFACIPKEVFKTGLYLKNTLCKSKDMLIPNSYP